VVLASSRNCASCSPVTKSSFSPFSALAVTSWRQGLTVLVSSCCTSFVSVAVRPSHPLSSEHQVCFESLIKPYLLLLTCSSTNPCVEDLFSQGSSLTPRPLSHLTETTSLCTLLPPPVPPSDGAAKAGHRQQRPSYGTMKI
jgi:hypothetical protein